MKNGYALDSLSKIVDIKDVEKGTPQHFFCFSCADRMIPKKGNIKIHHFAHKTLTCSFESYLHKLAKLKFYFSYSKCLEESKPFYLEYHLNTECFSCKEKLQVTCLSKNEFRLFDLTKTFNQIFIEKGIDGFIADILLKSSSSKEILLIEFAVTHECTIEKISLGHRIIELKIKNEDDLTPISLNRIGYEKFNIRTYNFKRKTLSGNLFNPYKCKNYFFFFSVNSVGKANSYTGQMREILSNIESSEFMYYKIFEMRGSIDERQKFIDLVKESSLKGFKVMNCHACRFFKHNVRREQFYPWFCTKHKAEVENSNHACNKIWRID